MKEIKFVNSVSEDSWEPTLEVEGFTNLGDYMEVGVHSAIFTLNGDYTMFDKSFLVIVDDNYFQIRVKNPEDIFIFLQDKDWYSKKTTRLLIFQLRSEWVYSDKESERWGEERGEVGFHPLLHDKAVKQIFRTSKELLNFRLENLSTNK